MTLRRMGPLPARMRFRSSITRLTSARRGRLPFTGLLVMALLFVQAAPASAGVFDELGGGFSGPSISTDRADYAPGDTVVLSGSGWLPGEHVHMVAPLALPGPTRAGDRWGLDCWGLSWPTTSSAGSLTCSGR